MRELATSNVYRAAFWRTYIASSNGATGSVVDDRAAQSQCHALSAQSYA
jgi:hypothetical protein